MWKIWYVLYSVFGKNMPESRHLKFAKNIRVFFARRITHRCDKSANIDKGAHFGPECTVGKRSGIGVNCKVYGPVEIGNDVMM